MSSANSLLRVPDELGLKDAIHVAIVSVRAARAIQPGQAVKMNGDREAVPCNGFGCGVANPWHVGVIRPGDTFWLLLKENSVPSVAHVWEHPEIDFTPPTCKPNRNRAIMEVAERFQVTYDQVMDAAQHVYDTDRPADYPRVAIPDEIQDEDVDRDFWREWADETDQEWPNTGSYCCAEYEYPTCNLFRLDS